MQPPRYTLRAFQPAFAPQVASWVQFARELFYLAPSCQMPLDADKVLAWSRDRGGAYTLLAGDDTELCAYGEVNISRYEPKDCWLGHLVVAPAWRGRGVGGELTRRLIDEAYARHQPRKVVLVVFPQNVPAVHCYLNCGFTRRGYEYHRFGSSPRRYRMLRMEFVHQSRAVIPKPVTRSIRAAAG